MGFTAFGIAILSEFLHFREEFLFESEFNEGIWNGGGCRYGGRCFFY